MKALGFIDDAAYAGATSEQVAFAPAAQNAIVAPHFVFMSSTNSKKNMARVLISGVESDPATLDADRETKSRVNRESICARERKEI